MTTYVFQGIQVEFVYDPSTDFESNQYIGPAELRVVVDSKDATFTYSPVPNPDPDDADFPEADFESDAQLAALNFNNFEALEEQFGNLFSFVGQVNWPGNTALAFGFTIETGPVTNQDFFFLVDGSNFPDIQSDADWKAFENSVTGSSAPSGAFGYGQTIRFADLDNGTVTEEDEFVGTSGKDIFSGGIGDDYFVNSAGNDVYNGGAGSFDQVTFQNDPGGVVAHLGQKTATDGFGNTNTLNSIEMLRGSLFDDTFTGSGGRNIMRGLEGADNMNGGKGVDSVRYDRDARYDGGDNGVTVNLGKKFAIDGFGDRDTIRNFENVRGSDNNDKITGSGGKNALEGINGNDTINGLAGQDVIDGGAGKDKINGGGGNDRMTGGDGNDRFIFSGKFGDDTITDFTTKGTKEKIDLSGVNSIRNFKDLKNNHLENDGGVAAIDDGNGNTITLDNLLKADLSANDFIF